MQYGEPGTSDIAQPGRTRSYSGTRDESMRPMSRPTSLRFHTPIR